MTPVRLNVSNTCICFIIGIDTDCEVVLSDLMTSVRPSPCKYIYVYEGDGSSKQSVHMLYESLLAMCDVSKYKVEKISPEEIKQGKYHYANMPMEYTAIFHGFENDVFSIKIVIFFIFLLKS